MPTTDRVSAELRAVEREIDEYHRRNMLMDLPWASGTWGFLAGCEESFVREVVRAHDPALTPAGGHQVRARADRVLNLAKWPMRWLSDGRVPDGRPEPGYQGERYEAARRMTDLADAYLSFESAFCYATWGVCELSLDGKRIVTHGPVRDDARFDAYDRLMDAEEGSDAVLPWNSLVGLVAPSVKVQGRTFRYHVGRKLVGQVIDWAAPVLDPRFTLPEEWQLPHYSLSDAAAVLRAIWALSAIHFAARMVAASRGCLDLGYQRALVVMKYPELLRRLAQYSGRPHSVVEKLVADLTYGGGGIHTPDIALQPLVKLPDDRYMWAPNIVIHGALERNLVVLLNRFPDSRAVYNHLSGYRESLLRARIVGALSDAGYRAWHGDVVGWNPIRDIDLAIICDRERCCLLLELKSFLAPADAREVREKGEEISRGIEQVSVRRGLADAAPQPLHEALGIDADYRRGWAVVSENSVGPVWVQSDDVPVIRAHHLVRRLTETGSLAGLIDWLAGRHYLPIEGDNYKTLDVPIVIGDWTLEWFGILAGDPGVTRDTTLGVENRVG